jgi:microcompartment protein CcmK/EutM
VETVGATVEETCIVLFKGLEITTAVEVILVVIGFSGFLVLFADGLCLGGTWGNVTTGVPNLVLLSSGGSSGRAVVGSSILSFNVVVVGIFPTMIGVLFLNLESCNFIEDSVTGECVVLILSVVGFLFLIGVVVSNDCTNEEAVVSAGLGTFLIVAIFNGAGEDSPPNKIQVDKSPVGLVEPSDDIL